MTKTRTLITMAVSAFALVATVVAAGAQSCYLAEQLNDPQARADYENKIAVAKAAATSRFGETLNYSVDFKLSAGQEITIDSFSYDCILCHDGMNAQYHDIRFRNEQQGPRSLNTVLASHPIGMSYGTVAYEKRTLRSLNRLSDSIVLVDGRVGCLSCHNLLNPEKSHLAMPNNSSELCLQCHNK